MSLELIRTTGSHLPIIAIDGPAGAGKSTAARLLASQLGFILIDTGAIYRSLAMQAMEAGIGLDEEVALADLCRSLKFQFGSLENTHHLDKNGLNIPRLHVYCNSVDVTDAIRSPELGIAASNVSKLPMVRKALVEVQRKFGDQGGIVMEGRDIGTVIFPKAQIKFFLTASLESRAQRRLEELQVAGVEKALEQVIKETKMRDDQDRNREVAPLKQAEDALLIDSTDCSLPEVVGKMNRVVRDFLKNADS
ncbi:(d)CMP kinase [bacterium]|nr:(d)CMP kinase [bacterium]